MEDRGATRDCGGGRAEWMEMNRRGGEGVSVQAELLVEKNKIKCVGVGGVEPGRKTR